MLTLRLHQVYMTLGILLSFSFIWPIVITADDPDLEVTNINGSPKGLSLDISTCTVHVGPGEDDVINLKPLARQDGFPRYNATFNVSNTAYESLYNYSFNPCVPFSLPYGNPHDKAGFADGCHNILLCKYTCKDTMCYYQSLGIHRQDKITPAIMNDSTNATIVILVYTGIKSARASLTKIKLVCDPTRQKEDEGHFIIMLDNGRLIYAELHHACCCVGTCWKQGLGKLDAVGKSGELMLVSVGTVVGLTMLVALIGGLCYVKRTHLQFYSKLPGIHPGGTMASGQHSSSLLGTDSTKNSDFRDYEPAAISSTRRKLIPVLTDSNIQLQSVEMGQRLGGGIFGDTHLAKWNEMTVTVKRLTLAIHNNRPTTDTMEWMKEEVWFLSRQRHKNIVCVLGLCLDGRLPFLLEEYVIGECLKDFLKVNGQSLTWPQRIRMCCQISDGMAFLHSTRPPIIHRDLRCGNLFLSDNDLVKVADFGLIKLLQPLREQCNTDDCSCQRQFSACPATVRWTAPELLIHPRTKEGESSLISAACDVYSFGLVMWEMIFCKDPFDEISTETEVIEIVRNGGRPDTPPSAEIMPQYKELMKSCWDQRPNFRPAFKQVAVCLKELIGPARSVQKQMNSNRNRIQKLQATLEPV